MQRGAGPGRAHAEGAGLITEGGLHEQLATREDVGVEPREESMGGGTNWGRIVLAGGGGFDEESASERGGRDPATGRHHRASRDTGAS